jgi:hypothetical protein
MVSRPCDVCRDRRLPCYLGTRGKVCTFCQRQKKSCTINGVSMSSKGRPKGTKAETSSREQSCEHKARLQEDMEDWEERKTPKRRKVCCLLVESESRESAPGADEWRAKLEWEMGLLRQENQKTQESYAKVQLQLNHINSLMVSMCELQWVHAPAVAVEPNRLRVAELAAESIRRAEEAEEDEKRKGKAQELELEEDKGMEKRQDTEDMDTPTGEESG